MQSEQSVVRLISDYHAIWQENFPRLHRRAQSHIVHHLCTEGRDGAPVGELYGLVKQVFLLDDATVKDRIGDLTQLGLVSLDPPDTRIAARTVVVPQDVLLETFDKHLLSLAERLEQTAAALDPELRARIIRDIGPDQRTLLLEALATHSRAWMAALDRIFDRTKLSKARRLEARRNLISTSHRSLVQMAMEHHYGLVEAQDDEDGILADRMAAALLDLTGQNFQTTRDHIAYLIDLGLLERKRGRSLRIAIAEAALPLLDQAMTETAAALPALVRRLHDTLPPPPMSDEPTLMIPSRGPAAPEVTWRHELVIVRPAEEAQRVVVSPEPLTIGRSAPSGLVLSNSQISRAHCQVEAAGDSIVITDLNSTNGTFVEGRRINGRAILEPGAVVEIGPYRIRYHRHGNEELDTDGTVRFPAPA